MEVGGRGNGYRWKCMGRRGNGWEGEWVQIGVGGRGNEQQWNQSRAAIPLPDIPLSYPPCIFVLKTRAFKIGRLKLGAFLRWDKKPLISRCLSARTFRAPLVTLLKTEKNFLRALNEQAFCFSVGKLSS
jgi:hypothetical protein